MTAEVVWTIAAESPITGDPIPVPTISPADYERALVQLLPRGPAWNLDPAGDLRKLLRGAGTELARVEQRAAELVEEIDPRTTTEMIEDWERALGLPEKCGTPPTTLQGRRLAAYTKLTSRPVGNIPLFLSMAAKLGYPDAEVFRMYDPFTCVSECTHALWGAEGYWDSAWLFLFNGTTENDGTLQCLARQYAQAHDVVMFEAPESWVHP